MIYLVEFFVFQPGIHINPIDLSRWQSRYIFNEMAFRSVTEVQDDGGVLGYETQNGCIKVNGRVAAAGVALAGSRAFLRNHFNLFNVV